jgi:hypothetical protein
MKKLFIALFLLLFSLPGFSQNITTGGQRQFPGPTRTYGDIYSNDKGIDKNVCMETTAGLTLYVRSTGSDLNNCLTAITPCLTIQAAVNKVPRIVNHRVVVDVGAGNFAGATVRGFMLRGYTDVSSEYLFTITGADYINFTPVTGTGSGTSSGGSTSTLIAAGQTWTTNNLRGKLLYVNGAYLIIRKNDATSLETVGISSSTMSGKAYVIMDWSTIITTPATYGGLNNGFYVGGISDTRNISSSLKLTKFKMAYAGGSSTVGVYAEISDVYATYLSVESPSAAIGINMTRGINAQIDNCYVSGASTGFQIMYSSYLRNAKNLLAYNSSTVGISIGVGASIVASSYLYADNGALGIVFQFATAATANGPLYAYGNSNVGLYFIGDNYVVLNGGISDSNAYGLTINCTTPAPAGAKKPFGVTGASFTGALTVSNNTNGGVYACFGTNANFTALTGTGNGGYGIYALNGAKVWITNATTVTGTSGDVKVGGVVNSYATDFATDNSYVLDISEGTIVKRVDSLVW